MGIMRWKWKKERHPWSAGIASAEELAAFMRETKLTPEERKERERKASLADERLKTKWARRRWIFFVIVIFVLGPVIFCFLDEEARTHGHGAIGWIGATFGTASLVGIAALLADFLGLKLKVDE
jgi:hypothetical protein